DERRQLAEGARLADRDNLAADDRDAVARDSRDSRRALIERAEERRERIARGEDDRRGLLVGCLLPRRRAESLDGFGERILLARERNREEPAADDSARFESPERGRDLAPRRSERLVVEHLARDDTPALEELERALLGE